MNIKSLLQNKISKNAIWIVSCKVIQSVLALIISMLTARYLGPSTFGVINYAGALVAFVVPVMNLGLTNILVKEIVEAPEREGEILGTSLAMSLLSSFACVLGVFSFASIVNAGEEETILVCLLYSISLIFQALEAIKYWFQAKYLAKYTSIISLVAYIIVSVYKVILLVLKKSVLWFALSFAFDFAIIAVALIFIYKAKGGMKFKFSFAMAKHLLANSVHYVLADLMVLVFVQTDRIMLKLMINDEVTGYYSAAYTCASMIGFVFQAIIDSVRPVVFESVNDKEKFELYLQRLYCFIIYSCLIVCGAVALLSEPLINVMYSSTYAPAVPILRVMAWYMPFSFLGVVRNVWILAENKQKCLWIINLFGALGNVCFNLLLIPLWDGVGAAAASVFTQFFTNVIVGFIIKPIRRSGVIMIKGLDIRCLLSLLKSKDKKV